MGSNPAGGPAGTAALLAHLQQCTQLTHLQLAGQPMTEQPAAAAAYAALTASSSLEALWCALPAAAFQAVFGGSKRLPRLQELALVFGTGGPAGDAAGAQPADLQTLVCCCPALRILSIGDTQGITISNLQPLTALTALTSLYADQSGLQATIVDLQTPEGQPPDVARRLHEAIDQAAAQAPAS